MKSGLNCCLLFCLSFFAAASAQTHSVVVSFAGMQEYAGMKLIVKVINTTTGATEDQRTISAIADSNFTLIFTASHAASFNVDFYVDKNGNGTYDRPPADPAWRRTTGPLHSAVTINFVNNTNYTDISTGSASLALGRLQGSSGRTIQIGNSSLTIPERLLGQSVHIQAFNLSGRLIWSESVSPGASHVVLGRSSSGIALFRLKETNEANDRRLLSER